MGFSAPLLNKDWLELSLEIGDEVRLEMSTGWGGDKNAITSTSVSVTAAELDTLIVKLQDWKELLARAWRCPNCKNINSEEETNCGECEQAKAEPLIRFA